MPLLDSQPWAVWSIVLPLAGAVLSFLSPRRAPMTALAVAAAIPVCAVGLAWQVWRLGPQRLLLGGWDAPLGIQLYVDGFSAVMVLLTALVASAISVYARPYLSDSVQRDSSGDDGSKYRHFWPVWLFLWAGMNALFLSGDIFNLYVTLELIGLAAVTLTALGGTARAVTAAMRYLLVGLLGSLFYLLGVALVYGAYATVDLTLIATRITPIPVAWVAMGLMTAGLVMKTALFPLHFWLPPAHASAPAPVSAALSALVIKASFYLLVRLWFWAFAPIVTPCAAQLLGLLGAAAVLWGSFQALRADRLKLLVAYSTVAQVGYLFLAFPLALTPSTRFAAWGAAAYLALSHAFAKAAMFLAAGTVLHVAGHDRIRDLDGTSQRVPVTMFAFGLAGVSIMGLPPSAGFVSKWVMINAALTSGRWWWAVVLVAGGLLAAAYVFRVITHTFTRLPNVPPASVPRSLEWAPLGLALLALVLGVAAPYTFDLLQVGAPASGDLLAGPQP